jgi:hypothetical protein
MSAKGGQFYEAVLGCFNPDDVTDDGQQISIVGGGGSAAAPPDKSVQFNNGGLLSGNAGFTFDDVLQDLEFDFPAGAFGLQAAKGFLGATSMAIDMGDSNPGVLLLENVGGLGTINLHALAAGIISLYGDDANNILIQSSKAGGGVKIISADSSGAGLGINITDLDSTGGSGVIIQSAQNPVVIGAGSNFAIFEATGLKLSSPDGVTIGGATDKVGFFDAAPVVKQATPATLDDVIAILQAFGLCS